MSDNDEKIISWDDVDQPKRKKQSQNKFRIGILGQNYLAQSVRVSLDTKSIDYKHLDAHDIDALVDWQPALVFVCTDIPLLPNNSVDDAVFIDNILKLSKKTDSGICIKTTINHDTFNTLTAAVGNPFIQTKVVYSPEVSENMDDILNGEFVLLGGAAASVKSLKEIMMNVTSYSMKEIITDTIPNIIFTKLGLSGFKAVKQTYFNQLHQTILDIGGSNPTAVRRLMLRHPLLTDITLTIPTYIRASVDSEVSYKQAISYGGEYANSDVKLLVGMTDKLTVLDECVNIRNLKD